MRPAIAIFLALTFAPLGALPAQTQRLGVFPEPFYEIQPALDRVLHLDDEQAARIEARSAPLRQELLALERDLAAAEAGERARLQQKLAKARAEIEPVLTGLAAAALAEPQKKLVALAHELHAAAARAAADELAAHVKTGRPAKLDALVRERLMASCPGLEAPELEQVEAALQKALARMARASDAAAAPAVAQAPPPPPREADPPARRQRTTSALLEALATGALEGLGKSEAKKPADLLGEVATTAARAAAERAAKLAEKLAKDRPRAK